MREYYEWIQFQGDEFHIKDDSSRRHFKIFSQTMQMYTPQHALEVER